MDNPKKQKIDKLLKNDPEIKKLPKEQQLLIKKVLNFSTTTISGPLPPPQVLADYEKIQSGLADRIIKMAENQSEHRRQLENKILNSEIKLSQKGQIYGFIIAIFFIISGTLCAFFQQPLPAAIIGTGGITTLVSLFVIGKKNKNNNSN